MWLGYGDKLSYDLLWYIPQHFQVAWTEMHFTQEARPAQWRAPTWSWASVKSAVDYGYEDFDEEVKILEVDVKLVGDDKMGELQEASLSVAGPLHFS